MILLGDAQQLASVDVGSVLADLQQVPALADNHVHLVTSRRFKAGALIVNGFALFSSKIEGTAIVNLAAVCRTAGTAG